MEPEQQLSLSWNNFHGNVSRELSSLLGSGSLADVTLAAGGQLLHAHRLVLSICSPYFKRMFLASPTAHPIVVLRDVTHEAMRDLLQFMYRGEVSVRREDLASFIATAELLQIKGLTTKESEDDYGQDLPKQRVSEASPAPDPSTFASDSTPHEEQHTHELEMKRRLLNERIQRLNHMKRKSDEFLQSNFNYQSEPLEKIAKLRENQIRYNRQVYNETAPDRRFSVGEVENSPDQDLVDESKLDQCEVKTEYDDIVVTEPAANDADKSFDASDHHSRDDASGLSSMFTDLKSVVSKIRAPMFTFADERDASCKHSLTTIPQKEDGKKKYPQRSCRTCWKIGKRRDTRFMCSYCAIPFCKTPCFEAHLTRVMAKLHDGDYALT